MEQYKYKMLQIPPNVVVQRGNYTGEEAAKYLQNITNEEAKQGWEFYRVDTFTVRVEPGCLGAIFGQRQVTFDNYVVTFRRTAENTNTVVETNAETAEGAILPVSKSTIRADKADIYATPGSRRSTGTALHKGNSVTIYGQNTDGRWVQIDRYPEGWVLAEQVDIDGDIRNFPVTSNRQ